MQTTLLRPNTHAQEEVQHMSDLLQQSYAESVEYLFVLDLKRPRPSSTPSREIIEFPSILIHVSAGEVKSTFHSSEYQPNFDQLLQRVDWNPTGLGRYRYFPSRRT